MFRDHGRPMSRHRRPHRDRCPIVAAPSHCPTSRAPEQIRRSRREVLGEEDPHDRIAPRAHIAVGIRGRRRGLPGAVVCIVVASMALLAPAAQPSTAVAGSSVYARTTRSFDGHDLRTRGYLDDLCLQARFMPCLTSVSGMYRPEGTAQALAIQ